MTSNYGVCIITILSFYVSNRTLRTDLKIHTIEETAKIRYERLRSRRLNHTKSLILGLGPNTIPRHSSCRFREGKWVTGLNLN